MKEYYEGYVKSQYEDIAVKFNVIRAVEARYIKQTEQSDMDNDLIEALVPMEDIADIHDYFEQRPFISPRERELPSFQRALAVYRLDQYRIGRDYTYQVFFQIDLALRRCYRSRAKVVLEKTETIDKNSTLVRDCEYLIIEDLATDGVSVIGISGGGKSITASAASYRNPQVIYHTKKNSRKIQLVYIKVECPPDGNLGTFYKNCLTAMEKATGIKITLKNKNKVTKAELEDDFVARADRWNLGMVIIEEIQQLRTESISTLKHFLKLSNDLKVPFIFIGTYQAFKNLSKAGFRIGRRLGAEIIARRYEKDISWDKMLNELWTYQWLKEPVPLTPELNMTFYVETAGIIDRVIKLFEALQVEAIMQESESVNDITPAFIQKVSAKYFSSTRDMLVKLSTGNVKSIMHVEDIFDKNIDKQALLDVRDEIERLNAAKVITDENRIQEKRDTDELCHNIIENLGIMYEDRFSIESIQKVLDYLKRKYKRAFTSQKETKLNSEVIELLLDPDKMTMKPKKVRDDDLENYNPQNLGTILDKSTMNQG